MTVDYSTITELPGSQVLPVQVDRAYSRYAFAASFCVGKDVLEVACGGGQGLSLLGENANSVVGGDCDANNLRYAEDTYKKNKNVKVVYLDAQNMPFEDNSFDVIVIYEAIYYLSDLEKFLSDCRRILKPGGTLIICTANNCWPDFNPSPFSHKYHSVLELNQLLSKHGFSSEFFGAFPDQPNSFLSKIKSQVKRVAVKLHLMPRTMKGKVMLKRLFYGSLVRLPKELLTLRGQSPVVPVPIPHDRNDTIHTAIFAVGTVSAVSQKSH